MPIQAARAPTIGPAIDPADSMPMTIPDSRPRRSGGALSVTQAIDAVHTVPLATPCRNRDRIRAQAPGAKAKPIVAAVISTADHSAILRAPTRGTSTMLPSETTGTAAG